MSEENEEWARSLWKYYRITPSQYIEILDNQGGVCATCKKVCPTGRRLAVDHDHETNQIRGLLCITCNHLLGLLEKSPSDHLLGLLEKSPSDVVNNILSYLREDKAHLPMAEGTATKHWNLPKVSIVDKENALEQAILIQKTAIALVNSCGFSTREVVRLVPELSRSNIQALAQNGVPSSKPQWRKYLYE